MSPDTCSKHAEMAVDIASIKAHQEAQSCMLDKIDTTLNLSLATFNTHVIESVDHRNKIRANEKCLDRISLGMGKITKLLVVIILFMVAAHGQELMQLVLKAM